MTWLTLQRFAKALKRVVKLCGGKPFEILAAELEVQNKLNEGLKRGRAILHSQLLVSQKTVKFLARKLTSATSPLIGTFRPHTGQNQASWHGEEVFRGVITSQSSCGRPCRRQRRAGMCLGLPRARAWRDLLRPFVRRRFWRRLLSWLRY